MTGPFGRALLVCDARPRGAPALRALPEIRARLEQRELEHDVSVVRASGEAAEAARGALRAGRRLVVAVGDDEHVGQVVDGLMTAGTPAAEATLGIVAVGRRCDLVRTFGIPAIVGHAVAHLDGPEAFSIDVARATLAGDESRFFVNVAEVGAGARVARRAAALPRWVGPLAHPLATWAGLAGRRSVEGVVDLVDRSYEGPFATVVVANGQFLGGGVRFAARAAPTDGLLDVLIDRTGRYEAAALLPRAYRGDHMPHPDIRLAKRVAAAVREPSGLPVALDGVVVGETPASFEVIPNALRLKV